jgi:hypothetical protein
MNMYCYAVRDIEEEDFSPLQCHINDDIAVFEIVRCFLLHSADGDNLNLIKSSSLNPVKWFGDHFGVNPDFLVRFDIFRLGIFDTSTGLVDGSCERCSLFVKMNKAIEDFAGYLTSLDCFKRLVDDYHLKCQEVENEG